MNFTDILRKRDDVFCYGFQPVYFNTGTLLDFEMGRICLAENNDLLIGGGFGNSITAVQGSGNTFKSTSLLSFLIKTLDIYPGSNLIVIDTEGSIVSDLTRLARFSSQPGLDVLKNIHPIQGCTHNVATLYELIDHIIKLRESMNTGDLYVDTPFINFETGKTIRVRIPLFILIDSWSEVMAAEAQDIINKEGLSGGKINTVSMVSGNKKSIMFQQLRLLSEKYGVSFIISTQLGQKFELDPFAPKTKQLQEMRHGEVTKGASSKYNYLVSGAYQIMSATPYFDSTKKECQYPYSELTLPKDLFQLTLKFIRNKANMTGNDISSFVFSQRDGLQSGLTNFDYLKHMGAWGLTPNKPGQTYYASDLIPDKKYSRKTIRKAINEDYETERALEICMQLHYVQHNWGETEEVKKRYSKMINPSDLYDKFVNKGSSIKLQDILNSRGYWTYDKTNKRPYMNIFKIMDLIEKGGEVKTKDKK